MKEYPKTEGKGIIISTYWNDKEFQVLQDFKEKQGISQTATAIKQGFLLWANLIERLSDGEFNVSIKSKKGSTK